MGVWSKFSEAGRVNQILFVLIGEEKAKQVFVKQEQGEIQQVFRGWEGQPNFICFDRRGKSQASVREQERTQKKAGWDQERGRGAPGEDPDQNAVV